MAQKRSRGARRARLEEASPVRIGDVVDGKYVITDLLAVGGMGLVAAARHEVLDQTVAIKFLLPGVDVPGATERFLREAKAAASIQSEHVVRVFDCGTLSDGAEGIPYMVMEHLDGCSLSQEMRRRGAMGIEESVDLVMQALEGVAEAHARNIVHRDLKPSNLFLVGAPPRHTVKVLDFGISKIPAGASTPVGEEDLTHTSMILGSPRYIAPEQARNSRDVDKTADIWSIGVILYQLIVGQAPFTGDTIGEILSQILLISPKPLGQVRPDVPPLLTATVQRCLQREPRDRYASIAELAAELAAHGSGAANRSLERIVAILGAEVDLTEKPGGLEEPETWITPSGSSRAKAARTAEAERSVATMGTWEHAHRQPSASRNWLIGTAVVVGAITLGAVGMWRLRETPVGDAPSAAAAESRTHEPARTKTVPSAAPPPDTTSTPSVDVPASAPIREPTPAPPRPPAPSPVTARPSPVAAPPPDAKPKGIDPLEHSD